MQTATLGSVFDRHLAFPSGEGAEVAHETFAERLEGRIHRLAPEGHVDPEAWAAHFFETGHSLEERIEELEAVAALGEETVLQLELGEMEFIVIEDQDEVVVVSEAGSLVLERTAHVVSRLNAARVTSPEPVRRSTSRSGEERAWHVTSRGALSALDAKAVAALLKGAALRVEPLARVRDARSRLTPFAPTERVRRIDQSAGPRPVAGAPSRTPKHDLRREERQKVGQLARLASGDLREGTPKAVAVEGGKVRPVSGTAARKLAARALTGTPVGKQTFAVKVGSVTALVQRPAQVLGLDAHSVESRLGRHGGVGAMLASLDRRGPDRFWIDPSSGTGAAAGDWVRRAHEQARQARARARLEQTGQLDPAFQLPAAFGAMSPAALGLGLATRSVTSRASVLAESSPEQALPTYAVSDNEEVSYSGPGSLAGAMPATTLRALYTGLDRTLAYEGRQLRSVSVSLEGAASRPGPTGREEWVAPVRSMEIETALAEQPAFASPVSSPPIGMAVASEPSPRSVASVFALPFASGSEVRIGGDFERELTRLLEPRPLTSSSVEPLDAAAQLYRAPRGSGAEAPAGVFTLPASGVASSHLAPAEPQQWLSWAVNHAPEVRAKSTGGASPSEPPRFASPFLRFGEQYGAAGTGRSGTPAEQFASLVVRLEGDITLSGGEGGATEIVLVESGSAGQEGAPGEIPSRAASHPAPSAAPSRTPAPLHRDLRPLPVASTSLSQEVNSRRMPSSAPAPMEDGSGGSEVVVIPLPLFVQMSSASAGGSLGPQTYASGEPVHVRTGGGTTGQEESGYRSAPVTPQAMGVPRRGDLAAGAVRRKATGESIAPTPGTGGRSVGSSTGGGGSTAPRPLAIGPRLEPQSHGGSAPIRSGIENLSGMSMEDVRVHYNSAKPAQLQAHAYAQGEQIHVAPGQERHLPHEAWHVVQQKEGGVPRRKPRGERTPSPAGGASAAGGHLMAAQLGGDGATQNLYPTPRPSPASEFTRIEGSVGRMLGSRDPIYVSLMAGGGTDAAGGSTGPQAYGGSDLTFAAPPALDPESRSRPSGAGGSASGPMAHEAAHVVQQAGGTARAKRKGSSILRFQFPTEAKWWGSAGASGTEAAVAPGGGTLTRPAPAGAMVVPSPSPGAAETMGGSPASARKPVVPALRSEGGACSADGASGALVSGPGGSANAFDGKMAYVAVGADGQAQVVPAKSPAAARLDPRRSGTLDMTVVAAIPPSPPALEDLSVAGRDRPHAKGKKEGEAKAQSQRSDSLSLQGTVDSLAQRIYHRLKRRLQSDRERFGG